MILLKEQIETPWINGFRTYNRDIENIIYPALKNKFDDKTALSLSPRFLEQSDAVKFSTVVIMLHNPYIRFKWERFIELAEKINIVFISSIKLYAREFEKILKLKCKHIPMSLDLSVLPSQSAAPKSDKILWFGNVDERRAKTFDKAKEFFGDSLCALKNMRLYELKNGEEKPVKAFSSHSEIIDALNCHNVVIAVGRSALEALALKKKVIVAGNIIGGAICSENDFYFHYESNLNSNNQTKELTFEEEYNKVLSKTYEFNAYDAIDIRNKTQFFIEAMEGK